MILPRDVRTELLALLRACPPAAAAVHLRVWLAGGPTERVLRDAVDATAKDYHAEIRVACCEAGRYKAAAHRITVDEDEATEPVYRPSLLSASIAALAVWAVNHRPKHHEGS